MEDALQLLPANLDRSTDDPDCGNIWKSRDKFEVQPKDEISKDYRRKLAAGIKENFEARCGSDFPPIFL